MRRADVPHRLIFGFISALFLFSYVNQALFTHTHVLPNGTVIVHAHPYHKESQDRKIPVHHHSHTPAVYHALSLQLVLISAFLFFILHVNRTFSGKVFLLKHLAHRKDNTLATIARAPPMDTI